MVSNGRDQFNDFANAICRVRHLANGFIRFAGFGNGSAGNFLCLGNLSFDFGNRCRQFLGCGRDRADILGCILGCFADFDCAVNVVTGVMCHVVGGIAHVTNLGQQFRDQPIDGAFKAVRHFQQCFATLLFRTNFCGFVFFPKTFCFLRVFPEQFDCRCHICNFVAAMIGYRCFKVAFGQAIHGNVQSDQTGQKVALDIKPYDQCRNNQCCGRNPDHDVFRNADGGCNPLIGIVDFRAHIFQKLLRGLGHLLGCLCCLCQQIGQQSFANEFVLTQIEQIVTAVRCQTICNCFNRRSCRFAIFIRRNFI